MFGAQPTPADVRNLALENPRAAYGIVVGVPRVPFVGNLVGQFLSAGTFAVPVVADLDTTIVQDTWIQRINYGLIQPNSPYVGSPFDSLSQTMFKFVPGISARVQVQSGPRYFLNQQFCPLENLADLLAVGWPAGWPLFKYQSVQAELILTNAPPSIPLVVTLTLLGWQFLDKSLDDLSDEEARRRLKIMGFDVPDVSMLVDQTK
jgi:hypothetical protein